MASSVSPVLPLSGVPLFVYITKFSCTKTKSSPKTNLTREQILSGPAPNLDRAAPRRSLFYELSPSQEQNLLNQFSAREESSQFSVQGAFAQVPLR